jgi:hypothetical protein
MAPLVPITRGNTSEVVAPSFSWSEGSNEVYFYTFSARPLVFILMADSDVDHEDPFLVLNHQVRFPITSFGIAYRSFDCVLILGYYFFEHKVLNFVMTLLSSVTSCLICAPVFPVSLCIYGR